MTIPNASGCMELFTTISDKKRRSVMFSSFKPYYIFITTFISILWWLRSSNSKGRQKRHFRNLRGRRFYNSNRAVSGDCRWIIQRRFAGVLEFRKGAASDFRKSGADIPGGCNVACGLRYGAVGEIPLCQSEKELRGGYQL